MARGTREVSCEEGVLSTDDGVNLLPGHMFMYLRRTLCGGMNGNAWLLPRTQALEDACMQPLQV